MENLQGEIAIRIAALNKFIMEGGQFKSLVGANECLKAICAHEEIKVDIPQEGDTQE